MILAIVVIVIVVVAFHGGHSASNYRHGRAAGRRGIGLMWYAGRGPWISVPMPGGFRVGHKL